MTIKFVANWCLIAESFNSVAHNHPHNL